MRSRHRRRLAAWSLVRDLAGTYVQRNGDVLNPFGAQCVNVPNCYWVSLGLERWDGNAGDWVGRSDDPRVFVDITEVSRLEVGDCLVWGSQLDFPRGHVALCLEHDLPLERVLQQNSPPNSPCHVASVPGVGASGVVRLR